MNLKQDFFSISQKHSATCFLNSFLREWTNHSIIKDKLFIPLADSVEIEIPLKKESVLGRHAYVGTYFVNSPERTEIHFAKLVEVISKYLATQLNTNQAQLESFISRVAASAENIETSFKVRQQAIESLYRDKVTFKDAEQGLMIGHNFHPTPKSRDEFSDSDLLQYSPEFGGRFELEWCAVNPQIVHQSWAKTFNKHKWTEELARTDLGNQDKLNDFLNKGWIPFPMHPWQFEQILKNPTVEKYVQKGQIAFLGHSKSEWYPTSSLRSLYNESAAYMLKYSMSLKVTNSIRHLLIHEVERGQQVHDVLATSEGKKFLNENSDFEIITEPAYICLVDENGLPLIDTILVCRENPFQEKNAEGKVVLATLVQDHPFEKENLVQKSIRMFQQSNKNNLKDCCIQWFQQYLKVTVRPMVIAQANYGIIVGAHQQNIVLDLQNGFPVKTYFRDCQGTGYSELGFSNFSENVPTITRENGNVLNEKMGNYLFSYYLIINSTFNVISAICAADWIAESELISELRNFLINLKKQSLKDSSCLDYLINEAELMHKGNFLCAFKSINENTTANPLSIYTPIKNVIRNSETKDRTVLIPIEKTKLPSLHDNKTYLACFDGVQCRLEADGAPALFAKVKLVDGLMTFDVQELQSLSQVTLQAGLEFMLSHFTQIKNVAVTGQGAAGFSKEFNLFECNE